MESFLRSAPTWTHPGLLVAPTSLELSPNYQPARNLHGMNVGEITPLAMDCIRGLFYEPTPLIDDTRRTYV